MHGRRHGSMILPFAPWEQKRTLLCQQQHRSTLQSEHWFSAVVKSAALEGNSLTARPPTELGRCPQHSPVRGTVLPGPWEGWGCCDPSPGGQHVVSWHPPGWYPLPGRAPRAAGQ